MKKIVIISCIFCFLTSSLFSQEVYPKNFEGTFIPVDFYNEVLKTKSYSQSIKNTNNIEFYTVVCLRNNNFWSNVKFHDGYLIKEPNFEYLTKNEVQYLLDKNTNFEYIKISDSTDYYSAYRYFLFENILKQILPTDFSYVKIQDNKFFIFNKEWQIDIDQYHYYNDLALIIYNYENRNTYKLGLQKKDDKIILIALKDSEGLSTFPEREILPLKFKSEKEFSSYVNENYKLGDEFYDKKDYRNAITHYENVINAYVCFHSGVINTDKSKNKEFQTYYYSIYNVACCYSLLKNYDEDSATYSYLYFALESGYPHLDYLLNDKDLEFTFKHYPKLKEELSEDFWYKKE
ncbi:MAG: hypothetical protein J6K22_00165 [Spirochaetaceae bacterium]|nr:hypothetical protein [Spirochaetaceae bacterium]